MLFAALATLAANASLVPAQAVEAERLLVATHATSGISAIDLHAGTGTVALSGTSASDAELMVSVRLQPRQDELRVAAEDVAARAMRAIEGAVLRSEQRGSDVFFALDYPLATDARWVREEWTVTLPPGLNAEVEMGAGTLLAQDTTGRLDLFLGVGKIKARTQGPGLDARVSYGDVYVEARSLSPGRLSAATSTGLARVLLNGEELPGRRPLPGAVVVADEGGRDHFRVRAEVGSVVLRVQRTPPAQDEDKP